MSRRGGGGHSATPQTRMSFNQGGGKKLVVFFKVAGKFLTWVYFSVQGYYQTNHHQPQPGMRPPQQAQYMTYNRPAIPRMPQMVPVARGQQPMQFQQPPPGTPGQQQQGPPPQGQPTSQPALAQAPYGVAAAQNMMVLVRFNFSIILRFFFLF